jgi:polysaccharide pyruvyl transferase WcaK-like protein
MRQMAGVDIVVATRYHNVICALKLDKPTISIGYADKNDALLAEMGLADFCQSIERLDVDLLKAQTNRMLSELPSFKQKIAETRQQFEDQLREQEKVIKSLIDNADH